MSFRWDPRIGNKLCRVSGHDWVHHRYHDRDGGHEFCTCVRCGAMTTDLRARGTHRVAHA